MYPCTVRTEMERLFEYLWGGGGNRDVTHNGNHTDAGRMHAVKIDP